ncbi:MAG: general secretion pathway protein GspK [Gammaproteobacteria bacterium]|nr:general secretion pathway protein GspK [Gammaproteobacteria bacterium]
MTRGQTRAGRRERGFILLAVLWILILAGLLLLTALRSAEQSDALVFQAQHQPELRAAAHNVLDFLAPMLEQRALPSNAPDWVYRYAPALRHAAEHGGPPVEMTLGPYRVRVHIQDTAGLIVPRWHPRLLPSIARALAGPDMDSATLFDRLRTVFLSRQDAGPASADTARQGQGYIRALPPTIARRLAAIVTRHPGSAGGSININTAPAEVLVILGTKPRRAARFVQARAAMAALYGSRDLPLLSAQLGLNGYAGLGVQPSGFFRVRIEISEPHRGLHWGPAQVLLSPGDERSLSTSDS